MGTSRHCEMLSVNQQALWLNSRTGEVRTLTGLVGQGHRFMEVQEKKRLGHFDSCTFQAWLTTHTFTAKCALQQLDCM